MYSTWVLLLSILATFISLLAFAAPTDENGALNLVQPLDSTSALGYSEYDARFAGLRRQSCPSGYGFCSDGKCVHYCLITGEEALTSFTF